MEITMLGKYGGVPGKEDACSSFMINKSKKNILVDCGSGCISNYIKLAEFKDLSCIIISHLHFDHISDLFVMHYAYKVGIRLGELSKIDVFIPASTDRTVAHFVTSQLSESFNFVEYNSDSELFINGINISFLKTKHDIPTYAMKFEDWNMTFGYTADTGYFDELAEFMRGCNVLISESGMLSSLPKNKEHMTPTEAYELARKSCVSTLILTHFWYQIDAKEYLAELESICALDSEHVSVILAESGIRVRR